jgi:hypothetical protein
MRCRCRPRSGAHLRTGIGGEHVRFQLAIELMLGYGHYVDTSDTPIDKDASMRGGNLIVGLIVR